VYLTCQWPLVMSFAAAVVPAVAMRSSRPLRRSDRTELAEIPAGRTAAGPVRTKPEAVAAIPHTTAERSIYNSAYMLQCRESRKIFFFPLIKQGNELRSLCFACSLCGRFSTGIRAHVIGIRSRSAAPKLSFAGTECQDAGGRSHRSALDSSARCVPAKSHTFDLLSAVWYRFDESHYRSGGVLAVLPLITAAPASAQFGGIPNPADLIGNPRGDRPGGLGPIGRYLSLCDSENCVSTSDDVYRYFCPFQHSFFKSASLHFSLAIH
jgi:hypothetical protein